MSDGEDSHPAKAAKKYLSGSYGSPANITNGSEAIEHLENQDCLLLNTLSFCDTSTLCQWKRVNKRWRELCLSVIDEKCRLNNANRKPKQFLSNKDLRDAVRKYCKYEAESMEEIACLYGFPINKWDVSQMTDFGHAFYNMTEFNEDISSWDISRAESLEGMFCCAHAFNQSLKKWDTSNVTSMWCLFYGASSFDQKLDQWDTSSVTDLNCMFWGAVSFSHRESTLNWDLSKISAHELQHIWDGTRYA